jgi:hypothetical protein
MPCMDVGRWLTGRTNDWQTARETELKIDRPRGPTRVIHAAGGGYRGGRGKENPYFRRPSWRGQHPIWQRPWAQRRAILVLFPVVVVVVLPSVSNLALYLPYPRCQRCGGALLRVHGRSSTTAFIGNARLSAELYHVDVTGLLSGPSSDQVGRYRAPHTPARGMGRPGRPISLFLCLLLFLFLFCF